MSIFKAYDIRGIYPQELNEEIIYKIAKAFAVFTNAKRIVVGGDNRLSTPSLKENFIKGLLDSGVEVTDIGTVATSMIYFACYRLGFEGGAMITASHNPKEFNGIKLCDSEGLAIGLEDGLEEIKKIIDGSRFKSGKGKLNSMNIEDEYSKFVNGIISQKFKRLKVVLDGSNGSAGKIYSKILRSLGTDVVELFCEPDGRFPNHQIPDPLIEANLEEIRKKVTEVDADMGFALDGDGDRLAIIDEKGEKVHANNITALLAEKCLAKNKNATIVYDVLSSQMVEEVIRQNGGVPVVWKVGHSFIPRKCKELDALFAGEASSHYFFKEANYTDDTLIAATKILEIVASENKNLSELTSKYPTYNQELEKRIPISQQMKFQFIENLKKDLVSKGYSISTLDGVKINFENGWAVFRASNTESKIVISYESRDNDQFQKIKMFVDDVVKSIPKEEDVKIIIFDVQDVLVTDWRDVFDLLDADIKPGVIAEFFDDHNNLRKEMQYGRLTEEEFWKQFIHFTGSDVTVDYLKNAVRKALQTFPEVVDIVNALKSNYKLVILSNHTKEWVEYLVAKYKFNDIFDDMFWSFQNGIKKPSAEAYTQITDKFKIKPEECIFIDDKERNIEGAKKIGMKTIFYKNPEDMREQLKGMGIKLGV